MSTFTVTAGHSDKEPGNTWGGHFEARLMDELGHLVASNLRGAGHVVTQDGELGENLPLNDAVRLIAGADLAIELHTNASNNRLANGVEVVAPAARKREAQAIAHAIAGVLGIPLRRERGYYEADEHRRDRGWNSPAAFVRHGGLIVEVFFQSNEDELATYLKRKEDVARAIASAMLASTGARL